MKQNVVLLISVMCLLIGITIGWTVNGYRLSSAHDQYVAQQQQESAEAIERVLTREREVRDELEQIVSVRDAQTRVMADELVSANNSADSLRQQLANVQRRLDRDSTSTSDSFERRSSRMLSELYQESDRLSGVFARRADQLAVDLEMCVRAYESLRE